MWSSKKYKRAAEKHYKSCLHILSNISDAKTDIKPHIISNCYYISGYILECIFKYYFLELEHKKDTYSLKEIETMGLKTHNIYKLWVVVAEKGKINPKEFNWTNMSKNWNESVRYETDNLDYKNEKLVREHFTKIIEPIYIKIKNIY